MKFKIRKKKAVSKKKSVFIEWRDAVVFAVVVATLFRWSFVEAFVVPTGSMENTILVGDYLFVSKFHYGTRTPRTPLQIPLTHQKIWGTEIPSYLDWIELPSYRLPGLRDVNRGEPVVFNVPSLEMNEGIQRPVDLKTYYVKRCVGIPGDHLEIVNKQIFTNGSPLANPPNLKFSYFVTARDVINKRHFERLKIATGDYSLAGHPEGNRVVYKIFLTTDQRNELESLPFVLSVEEDPRDIEQLHDTIFPAEARGKWNENNYGPLLIPEEGMQIQVNESTMAVYGEIIQQYEELDKVVIEGGDLRINDKLVDTYTFRQNYYFMMGDNRHNSLDSRFWGFVPENHIVGKPLFIWFSFNSEADLLDKVRWNRIFNKIE